MMPDANPGRRKPPIIAIVVGVVLVLIIVGVIVLAAHSSKTTGTTASPSPSSTAAAAPSLSPTPTPADPGKAQAVQPNYLNFDSLTEYGVTSNQEDAIQYAFTKFAKQSGQSFTSVSVDADTIKQAPLNYTTPGTTKYFDVDINSGTIYHATAVLSSPTAVDLKLANAAGQQVFDSGTIDLYNGIGDN